MKNSLRNTLLGPAVAALAAVSACAIEGTPGGPTKDPFVPPTPTQPYLPPAPTPTDRKVVLLHTTDEHSHLLGFAPNSEYPYLPEADGKVNAGKIAQKIGKDTRTVGGAVRRQYLINKIRAQSKDPVLLLGIGDATMGTLFHVASASAAPDYLVMGALGYDFLTLGNHEFDWGPDNLAAMIRTSQRTLFGGAVPIVASNTFFEDVAKDANGKPVGPGADLMALTGEGNSGAPVVPWATKTLANGLKIGFIGLMGYEAQLVAAAKAPIAFSAPASGKACTKATAKTDCAATEGCVRGHCVNPLDDAGYLTAMANDAQLLVDRLKKTEKVDVVVAMTHLGEVEGRALATLTSGIDVMLLGDSHRVVAPTTQASASTGKTILAQAGEYGKTLGQLTIKVSPQGEIAVVDADSKTNAIDNKLDTEIYAGTNLAATPPVLSPAFESGLKLTGGIIGPVVAGLNAALGPSLEGILDPTHATSGNPTILDPLFTSDHDVEGDVPYVDTNLSHLVTDAELTVLMQGACLNPATERIVAAQGNGVIRESLRFGADHKTTFSDVFSVLPLGASPWSDPSVAAPGFPITVFRMPALQIFVAADLGVTKGLVSDSFFFSYAGMRVTYDETKAPFDLAKLLAGQDPGGRVTKIEYDINPLPTGETWKTLYAVGRHANFAMRWTDIDETTPVDPTKYLLTVVTNLYLTSLMNAYGLVPLASDGGTACTAGNTCQSGVCTNNKCQAELQVPQTVMCVTPDAIAGTFSCATGKPAMKRCVDLPGTTFSPAPNWLFPEVKEWIALTQYLAGLGGTIPSAMYAGDKPASPRVIKQ